jgi:hypothetical protein
LLDKFGNEVIGKLICRTPGTPRLKIIRPDKDLELIDGELQSLYCSGIGMWIPKLLASKFDQNSLRKAGI